MKRTMLSVVIPFVVFVMISSAYAGDDPSIQGELRGNIGNAMRDFINENTVEGHFFVYDGVQGELKSLAYDNLHSGIVKKGDFYVSCADFTDEAGNSYDIDFLVADTGNGFKTVESLIHAINGEKRPYHVE
ncbi:hypothetical protein IIB34_01415 [PVC group bacterium]|nr:hypothetical protein [PVC group bacterium]